jgi:hypothetical protein
LLGIEGSGDFDAGVLDVLTPEVILRLDMLLEDLLQRSADETKPSGLFERR